MAEATGNNSANLTRSSQSLLVSHFSLFLRRLGPLSYGLIFGSFDGNTVGAVLFPLGDADSHASDVDCHSWLNAEMKGHPLPLKSLIHSGCRLCTRLGFGRCRETVLSDRRENR